MKRAVSRARNAWAWLVQAASTPMYIRMVRRLLYVIVALVLFGCETTPAAEKPEIKYSTLPTREVHTVFPLEFNAVHETCQHVLREELNYTSVSSTKDETTGKGRIDATASGGASVRIETERSRDLESTKVGVFAVEAGSSEPSDVRAREILEHIEQTLWPTQK